jgi:DNA-binding MarR family transcriptional regulator
VTSPSAPEPTPTEAILTASRALLGIVARSLAPALEVVTLAEFRILVLLTSGGSLSVAAIAEHTGSDEASAVRLLEGLRGAGWVVASSAQPGSADSVSSRGRALVDEVTERRRGLIAATLANLDGAQQKQLAAAFAGFADAAGEPPVEALLMLGL